ncbi:TPA: site-specific integrase [Escherichia coli]|nr:site-specific integrase [Escherichia coli]HBL0957669.1 site-specific integrase [Escherichia coli]
MYSLSQIVSSKGRRRWILMDVTICLPALYPLRYVVDHLEYRSPSTQSASLQAIKFFYDFWFIKHRTTFCYSFYFSGHDPAIAIHEMTDFFQYLENGRLVSFAPQALPFKHSSCMTNASRVRAVIRFIGYLIATYVSPYYRNETPKELSRYASRLNTRLLICKDEFKTLERSNQRYYSRVTQGFQSMTGDMVENVYRIVVPSSKHKNNFLNPFPSGFIQFRNYLIMRLMLNYGLRVGELLLLECVSVKASIKGDKFSLIISMPRNMTAPRIHAPSLKNEYSHRVLELDKVDYEFLMIYMQKIRKKSTTHNFIFASSQNPESPLSYNAVHLIFSEVDKVFSLNYPECKSAERFDALMKFTPHITRHTWAYLTIKKLYHLKNKRFNGSGNNLAKNSLSMGWMDEAKEALRLLGGWSIKSQMPDLYAKRFLSEQANAANIQRLLQHDSDFDCLIKELLNGD